MPPKKARGGPSRRSARSSMNAEPGQDTLEDSKPSVDRLNSAAESPPDALNSFLHPFTTPPSVGTTANPGDLDSRASTTTALNLSIDGAPTTTNPSQFTGSTTTFTTSAQNAAPGMPSVQDLDAGHEAAVPAPPALRGRKLLSQPKHPGRRSQARLQEMQRAENEKKRAEGDASMQRDGKARGGASTVRTRGRGRGGSAGGPPKEVASGPFGAAQATPPMRQIASSPSGPRSRSKAKATATALSSNVASTSKVTEEGRVIKQEVGTGQDREGDVSKLDRPRFFVEGESYLSSDEGEDGEIIKRLNVENLGLIDLTQDDHDFDTFAPVRVARFEHKERVVGINADGATNQEGVITVDANDTTTVTSSERKTRYKPRDFENSQDEQTFQATYSDSDSDLEAPARPLRNADNQTAAASNDAIKDPPPSPDILKKSKGRLKARALSADEEDYYTRDELDEWERYQQDLIGIRHILGPSLPQQDTHRDQRTNNVFLFQFPPIMPDLSSPTIKTEPGVAQSENLVNDPMIIADGADAPTTSSPEQQKTLPSGLVGKMRVHASGRVTLDWGGADMCLQMGSDASFLQDVVIANLPDAKDADNNNDNDDGVRSGNAMSLGSVKGKFVLVPDLDEIMKRSSS